MYEITIDRPNALIRVVWTGAFWDMATFLAFRAECFDAVARLGAAARGHVVLVDARAAIVQSQEVIEAIRRFSEEARAARIAFVVATALTRLQANRLKSIDRVQVFRELEAAEAWLMS